MERPLLKKANLKGDFNEIEDGLAEVFEEVKDIARTLTLLIRRTSDFTSPHKEIRQGKEGNSSPNQEGGVKPGPEVPLSVENSITEVNSSQAEGQHKAEKTRQAEGKKQQEKTNPKEAAGQQEKEQEGGQKMLANQPDKERPVKTSQKTQKASDNVEMGQKIGQEMLERVMSRAPSSVHQVSEEPVKSKGYQGDNARKKPKEASLGKSTIIGQTWRGIAEQEPKVHANSPASNKNKARNEVAEKSTSIKPATEKTRGQTITNRPTVRTESSNDKNSLELSQAILGQMANLHDKAMASFTKIKQRTLPKKDLKKNGGNVDSSDILKGKSPKDQNREGQRSPKDKKNVDKRGLSENYLHTKRGRPPE